jgi:hypothetical protein
LSIIVLEALTAASLGKLIYVLAKSRDLATALAAVGEVSYRYKAASSLNLLVSSTEEFKILLILASCSGVRQSIGSVSDPYRGRYSLNYRGKGTLALTRMVVLFRNFELNLVDFLSSNLDSDW